MKKFIALVLFFSRITWAHCAEPNVVLNTSDFREIANEALCAVLRDYNPPAAEKRVCFVTLEGAEASLVFKELKCRHSVSLKTGKIYEDYDFKDGKYWDKKTGTMCEIFSLKVESIEGANGVVTVVWSASSMAVEVIHVNLAKRGTKWEVVRIVRSALS